MLAPAGPLAPSPAAPQPSATAEVLVPTAYPPVTPPETPEAAGYELQPLSSESCAELAQAMTEALGAKVTQSEAAFNDAVTGHAGTGCQVTATGTGEQFKSPQAAADTLAGVLTSRGWTLDPQLAAGGPTGTGSGFRKGNQICLAGAIWVPDAAANCPKDQPISACQVAPAQQLYTVTLNCAQAGSAMANPASDNCIKQGGALSIMERGDAGQYGACLFADNRQCDEWALLRGNCPVGGVEVTGLTTPASVYCAITGGTYAVTGKAGTENEEGTCTFKNGAQCAVWDYFNGKCQAPSGG